MPYDLVFDAAQQSPDWTIPAFGLAFMAIGVAVWKSTRSPQRSAKSVFAGIWLGFAIAWTAISSGSVLADYRSVRTDLDTHRYSEVEGVVENFDPMPYEGHKDESFTVRGHKFSYSDYAITPYFRQSASHGGPLREGLHVRIRYVDNGILQLEVERGSSSIAGPVSTVSSPAAHKEFPPWFALPFIALAWPLALGAVATGGWRQLAERFPGPPIIQGERYAAQSVRLSLVGAYNGIVHVTVSEAGIHLVTMILFRLFHRPILIPWASVLTCERCDFLFSKRIRLTVGPGPENEVRFAGQAALAIERAYRSYARA